MIRVYQSSDGGNTWKKLILAEGFFDKRTLERLWKGEEVEYLFGVFTLDPPQEKIVQDKTEDNA